MPVLESVLIYRPCYLLMCSIWNRIGVVLALLGASNTGHAQPGQNLEWRPSWASAVDKTGRDIVEMRAR